MHVLCHLTAVAADAPTRIRYAPFSSPTNNERETKNEGKSCQSGEESTREKREKEKEIGVITMALFSETAQTLGFGVAHIFSLFRLD